MTPLDPSPLQRSLESHLDADASQWLAQASERVGAEPAAIATIFPAVARKVGRGPLDADADLGDVHAWTIDAAARTLLLIALGDAIGEQLKPLYRHGDASERTAILRALSFLAIDDAIGLALVEDALRTNDLRLIAAALGPYALERLDDAAFVHAVLKCVFVEVPLSGIAGLQNRATPQLAEMLARYVHERVAAGREVPAEVWSLIDLHPPAKELAEIEQELSSSQPDRRQAARAALDARADASLKPESQRT